MCVLGSYTLIQNIYCRLQYDLLWCERSRTSVQCMVFACMRVRFVETVKKFFSSVFPCVILWCFVVLAQGYWRAPHAYTHTCLRGRVCKNSIYICASYKYYLHTHAHTDTFFFIRFRLAAFFPHTSFSGLCDAFVCVCLCVCGCVFVCIHHAPVILGLFRSTQLLYHLEKCVI